MQQQGRLAGSGRALERLPGHADDGRAPLEAREHVAQCEGCGHRVELVAAFHQPGSGCRIEVGAERHHQHVRLERSIVSHHAPGSRVDGPHRGLEKPHARFDDVPVGMTDVGRPPPSEHHVEFREAEDEGIALVDEHDVDRFAEGVRKNRRQLQAAEAGAQHHHMFRHGRSIAVSARARASISAPSGGSGWTTRGCPPAGAELGSLCAGWPRHLRISDEA